MVATLKEGRAATFRTGASRSAWTSPSGVATRISCTGNHSHVAEIGGLAASYWRPIRDRSRKQGRETCLPPTQGKEEDGPAPSREEGSTEFPGTDQEEEERRG